MVQTKGFVLIELIVVIAVVGGLIGLAVTNLPGMQRRANLTAVVDTLGADIKSQQTKAMSSTVESGVLQLGYGVRFESNRYILFHGLAYNASDTSNTTISLPGRVTVSNITLSDNSLIFASRSGELVSYISPSSVTISQLDSGETSTLQFNKYGIITSDN